MDHVRDRLFGSLSIRRASGVVILATLASALGYTKREDLYEQGSYLTADERMWTAWFETGAFVAAAGLVFVALALLVGPPGNTPSVTESEPAAREQD